jgi:hypothetical protein
MEVKVRVCAKVPSKQTRTLAGSWKEAPNIEKMSSRVNAGSRSKGKKKSEREREREREGGEEIEQR